VAVAWLSEIEERDPDGNALCTGRFACGEGQELPLREAVALVALSPPDLSDDARAEQERVVERVAAGLAAAGLEEIVCSSDELDAGLADIEAQRQRAGTPKQFGWTTMRRLDFVLTAAVAAPSYRPVHARVRAAVLDEVEAAAGRGAVRARRGRHPGSLGRRGRRPPAGVRAARADALIRA
jgi:hypothetical protein